MESYIWRILLVDDDEDDFLITRDLISDTRRDKFILEWAPTYRQGLEALFQNDYDAVLVDFDLGPKTGLELIREVSAAGLLHSDYYGDRARQL